LQDPPQERNQLANISARLRYLSVHISDASNFFFFPIPPLPSSPGIPAKSPKASSRTAFPFLIKSVPHVRLFELLPFVPAFFAKSFFFPDCKMMRGELFNIVFFAIVVDPTDWVLTVLPQLDHHDDRDYLSFPLEDYSPPPSGCSPPSVGAGSGSPPVIFRFRRWLLSGSSLGILFFFFCGRVRKVFRCNSHSGSFFFVFSYFSLFGTIVMSFFLLLPRMGSLPCFEFRSPTF